MFVMVMGGSKCGKSRYAELLSERLNRSDLVYIATMIPVGDGEEGTATISRHRAQRSGMGFRTVEEPLCLGAVEIDPDATVLLEDVSNLLANTLFCEGASGGVGEVTADVMELASRCDHLIAVSFHGLECLPEYDEDTKRYLDELERANTLLSESADAVVLLDAGVPSVVKGSLPSMA